MMDGYAQMGSGDWFGMALLLVLWTVLVAVATVWAVSARAASLQRLHAPSDGKLP
jgi:hypothetical protein